MTLLLLCWEFFKTGLFAIGGGLAAIPFLAKISQAHPEWFSLAMLTDMIAVSESTPGPLNVNMSTYVGYTVGGRAGSVLATFSVVLPSFLIMLVISRMLDKFRCNRYVERVFAGLRPAVTGLIAAAGFTVLELAVFPGNAVDIRAVILFILLFFCMQWKRTQNLHPIAFIGISAVCGILFF